jgi:hypothetical protein
LQLFIEMGDEYSVNKVITPETINPLAETLFLRPIKENSEPNLNRIKIAQFFIQKGFQYLQYVGRDVLGGLHTRAIRDGLEACDYIVDLFLPPSETWKRPRD